MLVVVALLCHALDKCIGCGDSSSTPTWEDQARRDREEAERADRERAAAEKAAEERKAAVEREERDMQPPARVARIQTVLVDGGTGAICEAKRLLSKAVTPDLLELRPANRAIKAAEQKELLSERADFEKTRSLLCVDGTFSSCLCHGAHGGCCSHHGGVAGCEPYPTEISCPSSY